MYRQIDKYQIDRYSDILYITRAYCINPGPYYTDGRVIKRLCTLMVLFYSFLD